MDRVLAPETTDGPLTFEVTAGHFQVAIEVVPPGHPLADRPIEMVLRGPDEVVEAATSRTEDGRWIIEVPEPEPTVVTGRGGTVVLGGGVTVIGSVVSGGMHFSGGDNVIVNNGSGSTRVVGATEPVTALVRLPAASSVRSRVESGRLTITGPVADVDHDGYNATVVIDRATGDVTAATHNGDVRIGSAAGEIDATTHNGDVSVGATGTRTTVRTHNGNLSITAASHGRISASTHNGNLSITKNGYAPDVRTRTRNGRERVA